MGFTGVIQTSLRSPKKRAGLCFWMDSLQGKCFMGNVDLRIYKSKGTPRRKTNGSITWKCIRKEKEKTCTFHFPPAFVSVPYVNFRGVYLSTKFQGKFRMIQNEGNLLMDFVEDSFFTRKLPCWISDLFWDGTCLQKKHIGCLKKA